MNDHPHDSLPAFALGALDIDEARQVMAHVASCPSCRDDVEVWGAVVALLPYMAAPSDPPTHIKRRLFALVDAAGAPPGIGARARRWMIMVAANALALALVFGLLFVDMRQRTATLSARIAQQDQQVLFMSAATPHWVAGRQSAAVATLFTKPGEKHVVLLVHGLKPLAAGKAYQFWFATADKQVPCTSFTVDADSAAMVVIDAPAPADHYTQIMITIEPASGSQTPSHEVVLQAGL
jgi:anti-sigma-K factor RskA